MQSAVSGDGADMSVLLPVMLFMTFRPCSFARASITLEQSSLQRIADFFQHRPGDQQHDKGNEQRQLMVLAVVHRTLSAFEAIANVLSMLFHVSACRLGSHCSSWQQGTAVFQA